MKLNFVGSKKELYRKSYGGFHVSVDALTKHRVIVYTMSGYCMPDAADPYIDDLVACARAEKPRAMIADPREMKVLSKELQQAIQTRFWPAIANLGVKKNPAVMPAAAITAQSVHRMVRTVGETITLPNGATLEIAIFGELEGALDWVLHDDRDQKTG